MKTQLCSTPLRYPGGKSKVLKKIITFFPESFKEYREPFLGGGSIFLNIKQNNPSLICRINDLNFDLFCFWSSLKNNPEEFITTILKIKNTEKNGKQLYYKLKKTVYEDIFSRGIRYYVLNRISYSGTVDSGGYSQEAFEMRFTLSKIHQLFDISKLLRDASITSEDYTNYLTLEGKDVFLYLDPPYLSAVKSHLYGKNGDLHNSFNHCAFAEKMKKCSFKWLITLDDTNEIRKMFDFAIINSLDVLYGMDNVNGNKPKKGKELIISNYEIKRKNICMVSDDILKQFIKMKYEHARIEMDLPLKNIQEQLNEIIKENQLKDEIKTYFSNNKLYIKRKKEIPTITI